MNPKTDTSKRAPLVRLGELITQRRERNENLSNLPVRGVSKEGFIPPKQEDANQSLYNVFYKNDFVFNPARMEVNSIALNTTLDKAICSSLYEIFYVKDSNVLLPEYLNLFFKREEFARYCSYDAIGSARNYFRISNMQDLKIPLPSIEVQRELVAIYEGCRKIVDENLALIEELEHVCHAFVVDCKSKYPPAKLGDLIEECDERNYGNALTLDDVRGLSNEKKFITTKANMEGVSLSPYKIVKKDWFAYVSVTSRNGEKISLALYTENSPGIVSSSYIVFRSKDENVLLPEYLYLLFDRAEFDRYARFNSWGSARETFDFSEMKNVRIPLPPRKIQESIVSVYHCIEEAKRIVRETRERMEALCPALVQKAAHTA
ncbi:MAG: restriction endonuclease subunit S [Candidatus Spyradosoma sp.]